MCCISGSFSKEKLIELVNLGFKRGGHSYSLAVIDSDYVVTKLVRSFGNHEDLINEINESIVGDSYMIVHQQAPTSKERGIDSIHPSDYNNTLLWHNGILKTEYMKRNSVYSWDTKFLHSILDDVNNLRNVEGSFGCVHLDTTSLKCFRNIMIPLFYYGTDISSVRFNQSSLIPCNKFMMIDLKQKTIVETETVFESTENPYNIG